jgi:colanic acid/amylovoran biosynthesis glycosyltransferase
MERLLPKLRARGIEPSCLFLLHEDACGPTMESIMAGGFHCEAVKAHESTQERVRWILSRLVKSPCDVFVPNLVVGAYHTVPWVKRAGIPSVGILHSDDPFYHDLRTRFAQGARRGKVDALACVSQQLSQFSMAQDGICPTVRHIPYGVEPPDPGSRSHSPNLRLAYVGRFAEEQKRISEVARALCRAVATIPQTEACMIGDGPDRAAVDAILANEGTGLQVRITGQLASSAVPHALLHQDVLVLLSDYEGLPIAVLEAMAAGCVPVCLHMRSGIPELVEHNETGLLVADRGDSFIAAIRRLREEPGLWERLSRNARQRIEENYSLDICADRWVGLFQELHAGAGPKRPIRIPRFLRLPPPLPGFAHQDPRLTPLRDGIQHAIIRSRMFAVKLKRAVKW